MSFDYIIHCGFWQIGLKLRYGINTEQKGSSQL